MRFPAAIPSEKLIAYTLARREAKAAGLDADEAAKYARRVVDLPTSIRSKTADAVAALLDLPDVPDVPADVEAAAMQDAAA